MINLSRLRKTINKYPVEFTSIYCRVQLSDEIEAFTANLYLNRVHADCAKNEGHRVNTHYEKGRELIRQVEEYPADRWMNGFSVDMNIENYIDHLLNKHVEKKGTTKFNSKPHKTMLKGIVYGVPDQSFGAISFNLPLVNVLAHPKGPQTIVQAIKDKILPKIKDGNKLLNTNIPESIIKAAGLKEEQYVKPSIRDIRYGTIPDVDKNKINRGRSH